MRVKLLIIVCFVFSQSLAQQTHYQTQFRQIYQSINPAALSTDYLLYGYDIQIDLSNRLQWITQAQTPRTVHVSGDFIHSPDRNSAGFKFSGGAMLIRDRVGPLSQTSAQVRAAGIFSDRHKQSSFSMGISLSASNYRLLKDRIIWEALDDPHIPLDDVSSTHPEVSAGIFWSKKFKYGRFWGDRFSTGLSIVQLFAPQISVNSRGNKVPLTRIPHIFSTGSWIHVNGRESFWELSYWAKYVRGAIPNLQIIVRYQPLRTFWVGGGVNLNGLFHIDTGVNLPGFLSNQGNLKIGYAFDYNISAFDLPLGTSHELHLTYMISRK